MLHDRPNPQHWLAQAIAQIDGELLNWRLFIVGLIIIAGSIIYSVHANMTAERDAISQAIQTGADPIEAACAIKKTGYDPTCLLLRTKPIYQ